MEKNVIIAIVLSMLILLAWQQIFVVPQQKQLEEQRARQAELARQKTPQPGTEGVQPTATTGQEVRLDAQTLLPTGERVQKEFPPDARNITIQTPLLRATLTPQGARIVKWQLEHHKDIDGQPVELISKDARQRGQYPLEVFTGNPAFDDELNTGFYRSSLSSLTLQAGDEPKRLSLSYLTRKGGMCTKELTFYPDSYKIDVTVKFSEPSEVGKALSVVWGPGLGFNIVTSSTFDPTVVVKKAQQNPQRTSIKKIDGLVTHANLQWAAIDEQYFTAALFPGSEQNSLLVNKVALPQEEKKDVEPFRQILIGISQALSSSGECKFSLYAGPKERLQLAATSPGFGKLIDYGYFWFIAEPLAGFMTFLYGYVYNYGVVIILVTVLVKIIFYPLTHKSFTSMKKMQDLQPMMNVLREKYKKDQQQLNQELMKLYREKGVNPMGGCFPMLLQIPVFFALYQTLSQSIELRGAPFLWVADLSASETLFFKPLVLLMGVSMFWQQAMTPTTIDSKQAQVLKFMPILFTAMFWSFPSGLVLYWLMNNILTIGQQYLINKRNDKPSKTSENAREEQTSATQKRKRKDK